MKKYDHKKIEGKWQKVWDKSKINRANDKSEKKKFFPLVEFPFPSGSGLHTGHIRSYAAMDIVARKRRMQGENVLYPIGWDAFGLPTENYAIKTGIQPKIVTKQNTDNFRKQLKSLGISFDWSREVNTSDPEYYKWTQWIFLKMYEKGLAYKSKMQINWCPKDKIGLANEEVIDGKCERCGTPVEKREKEQWVLAITKYADRLYDDLDTVDYLEKIKAQQRNWIGRSEGAEIEFKLVTKNQKSRYLILHGFEGGAKKDFLPWLKGEFEKQGHEVEVPELPNPMDPNEEEQVEYVLKNCTLDENTVIIGHSLGAVVAMKVLMKLKKPILGLLVVAAAKDPKFPEAQKAKYWKAFNFDYDYSKIRKMASDRIGVLSDAREADRIPYLKHLANKLSCGFIEAESNEKHFTATQEPAILEACTPTVKVFTTRPDTIYGATYIVLSPEHAWVKEFIPFAENKAEITSYLQKASKKTDIERTDATKEKTGVEFKGIVAVNPATNKEIPVWIADYVLSDYGTGAIMAVPAHDERDYDFAKKFKLLIKPVVEQLFIRTKEVDAVRPGMPFVERNAVVCIVKHWSEDKYLCSKWKSNDWQGFVTGGIEGNDDVITTATREVAEETGYTNVKHIKSFGKVHTQFYHDVKKVNRFAHFRVVYIELGSGDQKEISAEEKALAELVWVDKNKVRDFVNRDDMKAAWDMATGQAFNTTEGLLIDSSEFTGMDSESAKVKITEKVGGKMVKKFKLRDWIFSRQRYWGEPIPMINCDTCGWVPVPEKDLPVKLPPVKKYTPTDTGESPLAAISKWVHTKCPKCKGKATRETDTMPNWAGSSWYYLRYVDPKNKKTFASAVSLKKWTPVDWYNGGMEHTTLHLLYSRFWHKFLYDQKLVPTSEPYAKRTSHGLILAEGGEKMSKSKGNVVNPDELVALYGADTLRMYEMFMGPFDQAIAWDSKSLIGPRRFIERVFGLIEKVTQKGELSKEADVLLQKTIKKVGDDIETMGFNTAVSSMMILINKLADETTIPRKSFEQFLTILAPFAPHVTEELWQMIGNKKSIHMAPWPTADLSKIADENVTIIVQVNGKVRGSFSASKTTTKDELEKTALNLEDVKKWIGDKKPEKVIVVPGKLVSIVAK
jgi:leucyl-tRNA synthetase